MLRVTACDPADRSAACCPHRVVHPGRPNLVAEIVSPGTAKWYRDVRRWLNARFGARKGSGF